MVMIFTKEQLKDPLVKLASIEVTSSSGRPKRDCWVQLAVGPGMSNRHDLASRAQSNRAVPTLTAGCNRPGSACLDPTRPAESDSKWGI